MEVGRDDYLDARDRALQAVVSAKTLDKAQAAWRLAKAHNRCAMEYYREGVARLESQSHAPAGRTPRVNARGDEACELKG